MLGDVHAVAAPPSIEQVVAVGTFDAVQAIDQSVADDDAPAVGEEIATTGAGGRTVQVTDTVPVPPAFAALTVTVCDPTARPL